jgi:hypothetical protein
MEIKYEGIFQPISNGLLRAMVFSAVVCNPKNKIIIETLNISDCLNFAQQIHNSNDEILKEFKKFVINNSMREMQEFLDKTIRRIYKALVSIYQIKKIEIAIPKKIKNPVEKINILMGNKLKEEEEIFTNLGIIRNCMSHNMHVVDKEGVKIKCERLKRSLCNTNGIDLW